MWKLYRLTLGNDPDILGPEPVFGLVIIGCFHGRNHRTKNTHDFPGLQSCPAVIWLKNRFAFPAPVAYLVHHGLKKGPPDANTDHR
jgi:hypothetical protein